MSRGQGSYYFGVDEEGFSDLTSTAALSYSPNETSGFALTLGMGERPRRGLPGGLRSRRQRMADARRAGGLLTALN
jgi:hypothetical protein